MTERESLRAAMRDLRRRARKAIAAAQPSARRIDVVSRVNTVVVTNTGEDGAVTATSARQSAPIQQGDAPSEGGSSR